MEFPAWDPVLLDIPGLPIDIRWYGLMYVVGFVVGQMILTRLARTGVFPLPAERVGDLVLYLVFGVILGGRLGYALFYEPELLHPIRIFQVWKGGLSFHGGLSGVVVALILFARKHRASILRLCDACALAVPPGIFAVRMANFINGELYGRVTEAGAGLAMRFPTDPRAVELLHLSDAWTMRDRELCIQVAFGRRTWDSVKDLLSSVDEHGRRIDWSAIRPHLDWNAVRDQVPYRHPSQLYEGIGEGILVGLVLLAFLLLARGRLRRPGFYGGVFLIGYASVRFAIEFLRQPDAQFRTPDNPLGTVLLGLTMGQVLCCAMAVAGGLMIVLPRRADRTGAAAPAP